MPSYPRTFLFVPRNSSMYLRGSPFYTVYFMHAKCRSPQDTRQQMRFALEKVKLVPNTQDNVELTCHYGILRTQPPSGNNSTESVEMWTVSPSLPRDEKYFPIVSVHAVRLHAPKHGPGNARALTTALPPLQPAHRWWKDSQRSAATRCRLQMSCAGIFGQSGDADTGAISHQS